MVLCSVDGIGLRPLVKYLGADPHPAFDANKFPCPLLHLVIFFDCNNRIKYDFNLRSTLKWTAEVLEEIFLLQKTKSTPIF